MKACLFICLFFLQAFLCYSQDFTNKGTEFWTGYAYHQRMWAGSYNNPNAPNTLGGNQSMLLYFTSDQTAHVTVTIPGISWTRTYTVNPNQVVISDTIPKHYGGGGIHSAILWKQGLFNRGIHITSDVPIVAYSHIYNDDVSGATMLLPVNTLGADYYAVSYRQRVKDGNPSTSSGDHNAASYFFVIATEPGTTFVEITPSAPTQNTSWIPGNAYTVSLTQGQIYNVMGAVNNAYDTGADLSGSRIRSVASGGTGCKRIAVFSGSGRIGIEPYNDLAANLTGDNLFQQVFPRAAWGTTYFTVPPKGTRPDNYFRIIVDDPATVVKRNGVTLTNLIGGRYYQFGSTTPDVITADKPVLVAQFFASTAGYVNPATGIDYNGDPEMIILSPVEQAINKATFYSSPKFEIAFHYTNVVIKKGGELSFKVDGISRASSFVPHPQNPSSYYYAQIDNLAAGPHTITSDSPFTAIVYGFGNAVTSRESYGYNAGTSLKDLSQKLLLQNTYSTISTATICKGQPFYFRIALPYSPAQLSGITWNFNNSTGLSPNANVTLPNPVSDSSFISDNTTFYVYSIGSAYTFNTAGTFNIKISANTLTSDGCSGLKEYDYTITAADKPIADFNFSFNPCTSDSVYFSDASAGNGFGITNRYWNFGDGSADVVTNPVKKYSSQGTWNVGLRAVNEIGCYADTVKTVTTAYNIKSGFGVTDTICSKTSSALFTDSSVSSGNGGAIVKWYWDYGDGKKDTSASNISQTHVYNTPGQFTATLKIETANGCTAQSSKTFTVHATPLADFSMPQAVCLPSGVTYFSNLSSVDDGSQLAYLWNFDDPNASSSNPNTSSDVHPVHTYSSTGPFAVNLKVTSQWGCVKDTSKQLSSVSAQPVAAFNTISEACAKDSVLFSDNSTVSGNSTVTGWYWVFSDGFVSDNKNPKHAFNSAGTYSVRLVAKSDKGCISDTSAPQMISINPLPKAGFKISDVLCVSSPVTFTDTSSGAVAINDWWWNAGDNTTAPVTVQGPVNHTYLQPGWYQVMLAVKDVKGCRSDTAKTPLYINALPVAGFKFNIVCAGTATQFTDTSSSVNGVITQYAWSFADPDATVANPDNAFVKDPSHIYNTAGTYNVTLAVQSDKGCTASTQQPVIVSDIPQSAFSLQNGSVICSNEAVTLKNVSTNTFGPINKIDIIWDALNNPSIIETDNAPASGKTYLHQYAAASADKPYTIRLKAYSGACEGNFKDTVVVLYATPTVTFNPIDPVCEDVAAKQITEASETGNVAGFGFTYYGSGISASGLFAPSAAGEGTHTIYAVYTSSKGCKDTAEGTIRVHPSPLIDAGADKYVMQGTSITLTPNVAGENLIYEWSPGNLLNNAGQKNPVFFAGPQIQDATRFTLTVTNKEGCKASDFMFVHLLKKPIIPSAFSPNGDGINDKWVIQNLQNYEGCTVTVFSRYGDEVFRSKGYNIEWDGSKNGKRVNPGTYYYLIDTKKLPLLSGYVVVLW